MAGIKEVAIFIEVASKLGVHPQALAAVMMSFVLPSEVAEMMHKHKLGCTACYTTGVGQPIPMYHCTTMLQRSIMRFAIVSIKRV